MSDHERTDLETLAHLSASLRTTLDYLCTQASLADLFVLHASLSQQAAQVARAAHGACGPLQGVVTPLSEITRMRAFQEELNRQQMQAMEQLRPWLNRYRQEG